MDGKPVNLERPFETMVDLLRAAVQKKKEDGSFGRLEVAIEFKEGWPVDLEVTDKTTYKNRKPS